MQNIFIARQTKNKQSDVVNALGKNRITKIYDLADIYHSDNIERVSRDFIDEANITQEILTMWRLAGIRSQLAGILEKFINA